MHPDDPGSELDNTDSIPPLPACKSLARNTFRHLSSAEQVIRYRLCELVERFVVASVGDESLPVLRASSYLQEIGVIRSHKDKAVNSLQMCEQFFEGGLGELDPRLLDTIRNHVRAGVARTKEARLMQICHKYAVTHYLDYMVLKHAISPEGFERLQLERIEAYTAYIRFHPRGAAIDDALQRTFYPPAGT
jgi:hypothetical protein